MRAMLTIDQRQALIQQQEVSISCVIPVLNEEEGIADFILALQTQLQALTKKFEMIVIDDGSTDNTISIVENLTQQFNVKLLVFSRNFGKGKAVTAGLERCQGDVTIIIDADFQHPIELIPIFLENWGKGFDVVYGIRKHRKGESFFRKFPSKLFYKLMNWLTNANLPANVVDFRLLDKRVVQAINQCEERDRFMKGLYYWVGFKQLPIPFVVPQRRAGKSSWKLRSLTGLALTGLISFSAVPLRIWGVIGLIISSISFAYGLYVVGDTLIYGARVPGFATIVAAIMFFGGIQLLSIGILGEYISRIFLEVKRRPQYIIAKSMGFEQ